MAERVEARKTVALGKWRIDLDQNSTSDAMHVKVNRAALAATFSTTLLWTTSTTINN
jgi:hypothetical protein